MQWKNFESWRDGWVAVQGPTKGHRCNYQLGVISTGKQRVFHRYAIRLVLSDSREYLGEDEFNLRGALFNLSDQLEVEGYELLVAGLDERFAESGLSHNTGFGYVSGHHSAVHIMAVPLPSDPGGQNEVYRQRHQD